MYSVLVMDIYLTKDYLCNSAQDDGTTFGLLPGFP